MPVYFADESIDPVTLQTVPEKFIIFYSSVVDGKMWCPDCRAVEALVSEGFSGADSPAALIVYTGNREQWKTPANIYRHEPWNVTQVPTIVKIKDGHPAERLAGDAEIFASFKEFITGD